MSQTSTVAAPLACSSIYLSLSTPLQKDVPSEPFDDFVELKKQMESMSFNDYPSAWSGNVNKYKHRYGAPVAYTSGKM